MAELTDSQVETLIKIASSIDLVADMEVDITDMPAAAAEGAALPAELMVIAGDDGTDTHPIQLDASGYLKTVLPAVSDTPEFFEDTSFVTGDSPVTLDINTALGRNATKGYIINDGAGNFTVAFSTDGAAFGDPITMKKNEVMNFEAIDVDSLKITWVADSAYRVSAI